jgi:hypothetical protein
LTSTPLGDTRAPSTLPARAHFAWESRRRSRTRNSAALEKIQPRVDANADRTLGAERSATCGGGRVRSRGEHPNRFREIDCPDSVSQFQIRIAGRSWFLLAGLRSAGLCVPSHFSIAKWLLSFGEGFASRRWRPRRFGDVSSRPTWTAARARRPRADLGKCCDVAGPPRSAAPHPGASRPRAQRGDWRGGSGVLLRTAHSAAAKPALVSSVVRASARSRVSDAEPNVLAGSRRFHCKGPALRPRHAIDPPAPFDDTRIPACRGTMSTHRPSRRPPR